MPLGILDYSQTSISREMIAALTENEVFLARQYVLDEEQLADLVSTGQVTAGVLIPPNFQEQINRDSTAEIQVFIDGVDANTAGIASGYISQIVNHFVQDQQPLPQAANLPIINPEVTFLYNPGLRSSWFFVPGMIGVVLTLTGSLVSAVTVVKEKDSGTLEQLLMTPAAGWEILLAKIAPLFVLLMGDVGLALGVARGVFQVPFQGSLLLFFTLSGLYISVGIGVGILLATISANQQQAVLTSFFFNLPLVQLSGAIAPIESMPDIFRYGSLINPLRHYITCARGILLKGVGISVLWPHILALLVIGGALLSISTMLFRKQLN
ncbi:MAG: ABC transporter permease [Synechococcaceae cyanobacterium SM2_3_1]|nr:ABC transporter permease [Synechococcaceae cyanobacterium SM2_3_1]